MKRSADPNSDKLPLEFRQKLENYKAAPSENLWDKIELSLDKEEALVYKNRFRIYARLAAACLALLLAFTFLFVPEKWNRLKEQQTQIAANKQPAETNPAKTKATPTRENSPEEIALANDNNVQEELQPGQQIAASEAPETVALSPQKPQTNTFASRLKGQGKTSKETGLLAVNAPQKTAGISNEIIQTETRNPDPATISEGKETALALQTPQRPENIANAITEQASKPEAPGNMIAASRIAAKKASSAPAGQPKAPADMATVKADIAVAKTSAPEAASFTNNTPATTFSAPTPAVSRSSEIALNTAATSENKALTPPVETKADTIAPKEIPAETLLALADEATKATEPEKGSKQTGRWTVAGTYAALHFDSGIKLAGRQFENVPAGIGSGYPNANIASYENAIQEYNQETSSAYSASGSILVSFKLAKNWLVQTGFNYLQHREKTNSSYQFTNASASNGPRAVKNPVVQSTLETVLADNFHPSDSRVVPEDAFTTYYNYQYVGVPLNLRFQTNGSDLFYFAGTGLSVNWLTNASISTGSQPGNTFTPTMNAKAADTNSEPDLFRNSLVALQVQTGLGYHFSPHWQAELALTGSQFLQPIIRNVEAANTSQQNPKTLGATLNLGYTF